MNENENQHYEVFDQIPTEVNAPQSGEFLDENYDRSPKTKTPLIQDLVLLLLGTIGITIVNLIIVAISSIYYAGQGWSEQALKDYFSSMEFLSLANFFQYTALFLLMVLVLLLLKTLIPLLRDFKKFRTYLYGVGFGFIAIFASIVYNNILLMFLPDLGSNDNQNAVVEVIKLHPLLSLIWIPFLGPIVEEFTYRLGLFNALSKISRTFAFIAVSIIFGLIHFNFTADNIWIELLNLPPYIISGLLFSYVYDRENIATSIVAHVTNNLVSYIVTVISMLAK